MQIYLLKTDIEDKVFSRKDEALKYFEDSKEATMQRRKQRYWNTGWQILFKVKCSSSIDLIKVLIESPKSWAERDEYVQRELLIDFPFNSGRLHDFTYQYHKK